uniref:Myelin-oligodendrocyte glycoprotein-like n=1 Tax=Monodelphis domestica TaxID=13616 RepID=A0A5F8GQQ6_MONDO
MLPLESSQGVMDLSRLLCHLFSFLISILLLEIPTLASGKFSVIGPTEPIQVSVGEVAELPCHLSPTQSAEHMEVVWFQSTRLVHLYRDGEDHLRDQDQDYKERTELVKDSLASGNVTLKIRDARLLDEGNYKCHFEDDFHLEEADVMLRVSEHLTQTGPWLWEINGILVVTWSYEIGIAMYFLWILLRCQGFSHTEESDKLDWMDWVAFLISLFLPWRMTVTLLTLFKGLCCCKIKGCCELSERNPRTSPNNL